MTLYQAIAGAVDDAAREDRAAETVPEWQARKAAYYRDLQGDLEDVLTILQDGGGWVAVDEAGYGARTLARWLHRAISPAPSYGREVAWLTEVYPTTEAQVRLVGGEIAVLRMLAASWAAEEPVLLPVGGVA